MNGRDGVQVRQTGSNGSHAHKREVDDGVDGVDIGAGAGDASTNDRTNGAAARGPQADAVLANDSGGARYEGREGLEALCSNGDVLCAEDAAAIGTPLPTTPSLRTYTYTPLGTLSYTAVSLSGRLLHLDAPVERVVDVANRHPAFQVAKPASSIPEDVSRSSFLPRNGARPHAQYGAFAESLEDVWSGSLRT